VRFARAGIELVRLAQLGKRSRIERVVGTEVAAAAGVSVEVMVWVTVTVSSSSLEEEGVGVVEGRVMLREREMVG